MNWFDFKFDILTMYDDYVELSTSDRTYPYWDEIWTYPINNAGSEEG